jgi:HEAT repeat protein
MEKLAAQIIKAYAQHLDGLTPARTANLPGISETCRTALPKALQTGNGGLITPEKREALQKASCPATLIQGIAGRDGAAALSARARYLGDQLPYRWWSFSNRSSDERLKILKELSEMGPSAEAALPGLRKALRSCQRITEPFEPNHTELPASPVRLTPSNLEDLRVCAAASAPLLRLGPQAAPELAQARKVAKLLFSSGLADETSARVLRDEMVDRQAPMAARRAAASSLALIPQHGTALLAAVLTDTSDEAARALATMTLASTGDARAAEALRPALLRGEGSEVPSAALIALVGIGRRLGRPAIAVFEEGLASEKTSVRFLAITGLSEIGEPAFPSLIKAAKTPRPDVRRIAAIALGRHRRTEGFDALEQMADRDVDPACRAAAQKSLRQLAQPRAKAR